MAEAEFSSNCLGHSSDTGGRTSPHVRIGYHNKIYKGMIDTGSSINIIREHFENLEEKEEDLRSVYYLRANKIKEKHNDEAHFSMNVCSEILCPQIFNYDFLLGRKYLEDTKAKIDYDNETVTLGSKTF